MFSSPPISIHRIIGKEKRAGDIYVVGVIKACRFLSLLGVEVVISVLLMLSHYDRTPFFFLVVASCD